MMNRSRRGAASVNITWMIVVLIAFFAALAMVFVFDGELSKAKIAADEAAAKEVVAVARYDAEVTFGRDVSEQIGFYDHDAASARTITEQAKEGLTQFKDAFNINEASVVDFETMVKRAVEDRNRLTGEIRDLKAQVTGLQGDVDVNTTNLAAMTTDKDGQIRTLTTQLSDAEQAAATRANELESELAAVRSTLSDTESQLTSSKGETSNTQRAAREREAEYATRLENVTRKLEWAREPERPDGKILDVSEKLGLAYIDLGKSNRLYGGMRFAIVDGRTGDGTIKAYCEVLNVMAGMSEVKITNVRDAFDPPTAGDIIFNPIYDPTGLRNAVLVGRFSGTYNENELRAVLEGINVNVQTGLDKTTDYLIVGAELYTNEDGEPLDDPMQPSDLPTYKEAQAMGVRIVPLKLVTDYFRKAN
ncbi:MAG: putative nucleic acid-binding Zn-ribbon protein [Candidatus Paceibacteria bacterium]|jgi:predicted  nucleic acid-binding Zn-ribbon protein